MVNAESQAPPQICLISNPGERPYDLYLTRLKRERVRVRVIVRETDRQTDTG